MFTFLAKRGSVKDAHHCHSTSVPSPFAPPLITLFKHCVLRTEVGGERWGGGGEKERGSGGSEKGKKEANRGKEVGDE